MYVCILTQCSQCDSLFMILGQYPSVRYGSRYIPSLFHGLSKTKILKQPTIAVFFPAKKSIGKFSTRKRLLVANVKPKESLCTSPSLLYLSSSSTLQHYFVLNTMVNLRASCADTQLCPLTIHCCFALLSRFKQSPLTMVLVICIVVLYLLLLGFCVRADRHDKTKLGAVYLDDNTVTAAMSQR